ncbi:MAG: hypothetical protein FWD72_02495 [Eggerthellaceae bacterium]|nr:hypothetical protein [Eggerthellaceae bacterium]
MLRKMLVALLLVAVLGFVPATRAFAAEGAGVPGGAAGIATMADTPDEVGTAAEFIQWKNDHFLTGGSVVFTDTITLTAADLGASGYVTIDCQPVDGQILIDTASYGLITEVPLVIGANTQVTGSGTPLPVIHVLNGGELWLRPDVDFSTSSVTATGDGGMAVSLDDGAFFSCLPGSSVCANGADGVALYAAGDCVNDPYDQGIGFNGGVFEATGTGGRAIVSGAAVNLFLCEVRADAAAVEAPAVVLDTCGEVSPSIAGATVIRRTFVPDNISPYPNKLIMGDSATLTDLATPSVYTGVALYGYLVGDGLEDRYVSCTATFDISQVDIDTPGIYPMPLIIPAPYCFAVIGQDLTGFKTEVVDARVPSFVGSTQSWFGSEMLEYYFTGDPDELVLWRSDDLGVTWYPYWRGTDDPDANDNLEVVAMGTSLYLTVYDMANEMPGEVLLVFEVPSLGVDSKTLTVNYAEGEVTEGGTSGDRTGTDRNTGEQGSGRGSGSGGSGTQSGGSTPTGGSQAEQGGSGSDSGATGITSESPTQLSVPSATGTVPGASSAQPGSSEQASPSSEAVTPPSGATQTPLSAGATSDALQPPQGFPLWLAVAIGAAIVVIAVSMVAYARAHRRQRG